jgi:endoglucanase
MTLPASAFPLRVSGSSILGHDGSPVRLAGVNWAGAYQDNRVPTGLDKLHRSKIIDRVAGWGMNHIRLPFAIGTFMNKDGSLFSGAVSTARVAANPDLRGLSPWQVYTQLADDITAAGLYCVLNKHLSYPGGCCADVDNNGLWYNDNWPSALFTDTWVMLAERFRDNPLTGYDLHNEPRPATIGGSVRTPTWGTGSGGSFPTDFRSLYQNTIGRLRAAEAGISHLVFCEGLSYAGDLRGWGANPVTGANIVASAHDYPWFHQHADKSPQTWAEYSAQNEARFGYLETQGKAPVWIGECGSNTDSSRAAFNHGWFPNFLRWARENDSHWCWWNLSSTEQTATQPATNKVLFQDGQREGFGLMAGQDLLGSQADALASLAPIIPSLP